jgi:hypothetical protein
VPHGGFPERQTSGKGKFPHEFTLGALPRADSGDALLDEEIDNARMCCLRQYAEEKINFEELRDAIHALGINDSADWWRLKSAHANTSTVSSAGGRFNG